MKTRARPRSHVATARPPVDAAAATPVRLPRQAGGGMRHMLCVVRAAASMVRKQPARPGTRCRGRTTRRLQMRPRLCGMSRTAGAAAAEQTL